MVGVAEWPTSRTSADLSLASCSSRSLQIGHLHSVSGDFWHSPEGQQTLTFPQIELMRLFPALTAVLLSSTLLIPVSTIRAQSPPTAGTRLELQTGDRVLLLGDALLEREDQFGILETLLNEQ